MNTIKTYIIILIILSVIDVGFLTLMKSNWDRTILKIQKTPLKLNYIYAIISYLILAYGILYYIENVREKTVVKAFILGFIIYAVFDFTNLALFKDYPLGLAIIDMVWGGILYALTYTVYKYVTM